MRWWCNESPGNCIESNIKHAFKTKMERRDIKLFSDLRTYLGSLPKRESNAIINLWEQPFYARERDLCDMAKCLDNPSLQRGPVMYMAAPSQSGKTAAVLPAFLYAMKYGVNLSHYIYMPFYNNKGRFHEKVPLPDWLLSLPESDLERIGMSYMLVCLEKLLFEDSYFNLHGRVEDQ